MNQRQSNVAQYCDGVKTSKEIALLAGETHKYVQEVFLKFDLPRRKKGSAFGKLNGSYKYGRKIDRDGYVLVSAPAGHPNARLRSGRNTGLIYEHRLLMENYLGRYLTTHEIVDHIDGLRLHNSLDNLRLFENNSEHLKVTISNQIPNWSQAGRDRLLMPKNQRMSLQPINTYALKKKNGDARLIQILRLMLKLGKDSQYLLGTHHHLKKAGISDFSHSNLKHELDLLYQKYA